MFGKKIVVVKAKKFTDCLLRNIIETNNIWEKLHNKSLGIELKTMKTEIFYFMPKWLIPWW